LLEDGEVSYESELLGLASAGCARFFDGCRWHYRTIHRRRGGSEGRFDGGS